MELGKFRDEVKETVASIEALRKKAATSKRDFCREYIRDYTSSFVYISRRFKDGYDGDLQKRLIDPESEEEGDRRKQLAKELGM